MSHGRPARGAGADEQAGPSSNPPSSPPSSGRRAAPSSQGTPGAQGGGEPVRRVLVIDDTPSIHQDFRKILCPTGAGGPGSDLDALESELFGGPAAPRAETSSFEVHTSLQGREGCELLSRMTRAGRPFALAFVDMRMPPGWDGVETAGKLWSVDPELEIVICSAYSDYSWNEVIRVLKRPELRFLRKPFEAREVLDLAWQLTGRWLRRRAGQRT